MNTESTSRLSASERDALLGAAAASIEASLAAGRYVAPPPVPLALDRLVAPGASFVTLYSRAELRGCRGTLDADRPLLADVWHNAWASAFDDPRFEPLAYDEWSEVRLAVSVLSPMEPLTTESEAALLAALRPGIDGLVISLGSRRATFLPSVWSQLPDRRTFLDQLKCKAGLGANFWSPALRAWRYTTESFGTEAA